MAKGGRRAHSGAKRKATDIKLLQGTFRGDRHGQEVVVPLKWPEAPGHLNDRERGLWEALEAHCKAWVAPSDWVAINGVVSLMDRLLTIQDAMRAVGADGQPTGAGNPISFKYTPSADGEPNVEPKDNPLYGMELKFWTALRGYIGITGLSPVDRARVQKSAGEEAPKSALDRFVKKAR